MITISGEVGSNIANMITNDSDSALVLVAEGESTRCADAERTRGEQLPIQAQESEVL